MKSFTKRDVMKLLLVLLTGGLLFFSNLGGWDLWNPDEPRYAEIAREMIQGGTWVIPHLNGEVYFDKPPLFFAMIAGAAKALGGVNSWSARLPSAIFGTLGLIVLYALGRALRDGTTGLLAALMTATTVEYLWLARRANIDATLTFFTTGAIFFFWTGAKSENGKVFLYLMGYIFMAVGFLTKLQPAVLIPVLALGPYFILKGRWSFFVDKKHIPGLLVFTGIVGGWLLLALKEGGPEYLKGLLWEKTASTFFKVTTTGHKRPFFYYFYNFPAQFFPWSFFLPSAIIYALRTHKEELVFPLSWFAAGFLFFSLAQAKRGLYLLPLYPAAALLVAVLWRDEDLRKGLLRTPLLVLAAVLVFTGMVVPFPVMLWGRKYLQHALEIGVVTGVMLTSGGTVLWLSVKKIRRPSLALVLVVSLTSILWLYGVWRIFPEVNPYKSARPLSERVLEVMAPEDSLAVYKLQGAEFNFYTGRVPIQRIYRPEDLKAYLDRPGRAFCILREKHLRKLSQELTSKVHVVTRGRVGHKKLVVISNRG
ncbi:MAG TPA: glycosyltransferase family 39 protein [Deltaproteobacteria bacterium]|nr:glycosyltransferase family 39 protein [Deltaproteobacteria bacterium]